MFPHKFPHNIFPMILIPEPINGDSSIRYNQYSKLIMRQITEIVWFWYWECAHNSGSFWCGLPMRIVTFLLIGWHWKFHTNFYWLVDTQKSDHIFVDWLTFKNRIWLNLIGFTRLDLALIWFDLFSIGYSWVRAE